jgi:outer membrane protein assembly factor BamE
MIALTVDNNLSYHIVFQGKTVIAMRFRFIFLVLSLTACSPSVLYTPHQMDVQQGNAVTESMLGKVKLGMTKSQVRFALGTPLIADPFHADRWDYVYRYRKDGDLIEHSRLTVVFVDDKLTTVEGTVLPPGNNVASTKPFAPVAVSVLALAPQQPRSDTPPALLDLKQLDIDFGAAQPTPPPSADAAKPATGQSQVQQPEQAQADQPDQGQKEQPKKSFGERFMRLFGFGKKDESQHAGKQEETQQAKLEEKPKAMPEQLPETQSDVEAQTQRSFGERLKRLFGFGKKDEAQQAKVEEKPETEPETQQEDAETPTNTVITADRAPPPKRSVSERFMRLLGFKEKEGDDPAPPVTTEVNTTVPKLSSVTFKQVVKQVLGLEDDKDNQRKAASEDIEPGEKVNTAAKGSSWQRFKRLIGVSSDEGEQTFTPVDQQTDQTAQTDTDAKPEAAKSGTAKP